MQNRPNKENMRIKYLHGRWLGSIDALDDDVPWPASDHAGKQSVQIVLNAQMLRVFPHLVLIPRYYREPQL